MGDALKLLMIIGLLLLSTACESPKPTPIVIPPELIPLHLRSQIPPAPQSVKPMIQALKQEIGLPKSLVTQENHDSQSPKTLPVLEIPNLTPAAKEHPQKKMEYPRSYSGGGTDTHSHANASEQNNQNINDEYLSIDDVILTATGESILGQDAPAALVGNYAGKQLSITILGDFSNTSPPVKLETMAFFNEPPLLRRSFNERSPQVRVLMDEQILWQPVEADGAHIVVKLDTFKIPEFYLVGPHRLQVQTPQYFSQVKIQIGEPEQSANLIPTIQEIQVLKDADGKPQNLLLTGLNHPIFYKYSYSTVNGQFAWGHGTEVIETENGPLWQTIVHLPDPDNFDEQNFSIVYSTPWGSAFRQVGETVPPEEEAPPEAPNENEKVTICHIPPGNANAKHTIAIATSALQAHLGHGDTMGPCEEAGE